MHRVVVPRLSGIHKFACRSLYRALLRQSAKLSPTILDAEHIKQEIRYKFQKHKNLESPSQTINALQAGYEALDLLHSVSLGDKDGIRTVSSLLAESRSIKQHTRNYHSELMKSIPIKIMGPLEKKRKDALRYQNATTLRHPDTQPILSRPNATISGRRRIPVLVNARGVPFLRIKKPQPQNLSRVIRTKLENRWKRIVRRDRLEQVIAQGMEEDYWDELVDQRESFSWATEARSSFAEVCLQIEEGDKKNKELSEAMWTIVLAEKKLAEEEQVQRKAVQAQELRQKEQNNQPTVKLSHPTSRKT